MRTLKNQGQTEVDDKQLDLNNNNAAAKKKQNRQEDAQKSRFPTCLSAETPQLSTTMLLTESTKTC